MVRTLRQRFPTAWSVGVRFAVVGAVLLVGLVLGRVAVRFKEPVIVLAVAALPLAGLAVMRMGRSEYGVLAVILAAATIRFTLPTGTMSRIPISLVLSAAIIGWWLLDQLFSEKRLWLESAPTNAPLLGFVAVCIVSYVWSNVFRDPLVVTWSTWPFVQLGGLAVMVLLPGMYLVTANQLRHTRWIVWLAVVILAVGTLALVGYYLHIRFLLTLLQVRPLFPTWFICIALCLGLFNRRLPLGVRLLLIGLAGVWFFRVFVRQFRWISSWAPALVALGGIGLLRSRKFVVVISILLAVYLIFNMAFIEAKLQEESQASGVTRLDAWLHNWRVTKHHWLFGTGPAGYAVYYMTYFPMEAMATHSTYIDTLSQTGVVGLLFFLWFWGAVGRVLWRLYRRVKGRADFVEAFTLAAIGGYLGALVAMALGDWIVPFVYTQTISGFDYAVYTWALLGAAQALAHIVAKEEPGRVA